MKYLLKNFDGEGHLKQFISETGLDCYCPVCGSDSLEGAYSCNGSPSYEKCPECGVEFGFDDDAAAPRVREGMKRAEILSILRDKWFAEVPITEEVTRRLTHISVVIDPSGFQVSDEYL